MPELVYLQTRKLLRDEHFKRRSEKQQNINASDGDEVMQERPYGRIDEEAEEAEEDSESKVRVATGNKRVSFNPNL